MVEYSICARQEMRARQKFFQHDIPWSILYILGIFKIRISFKLIAVDAFEYRNFSWKIQKKIENFQNFQICKIFGKNRIFKKNFKLQIALKNSLFKLWPNKKIATRFYHKYYISKKILARAESHIAVKTQKSCFSA